MAWAIPDMVKRGMLPPSAMDGFMAPPSHRTFVQRFGPNGLGAPVTLYSGRSRSAALASARAAAQQSWPERTVIGVLGPCPPSWIGNASCYACLQKLSKLGWQRVTPSIDACSTSSYLGDLGAMYTAMGRRFVPPGIVPPGIAPWNRGYGAEPPPPPSRPRGPTAPSGTRPLPVEPAPSSEAGAGGGAINPFYVGLAVTVGVMVAMVIWE